MQKPCPSCGAETFAGARFCRRCGSPLHGAAADDGTGEVSPQAATVPLTEEPRTTDGLADGEKTFSSDTSRVSRAELERILQTQNSTGRAPSPDTTHSPVTRPGVSAPIGAQTRGDTAQLDDDPEATFITPPIDEETRPSFGVEFDEELTVTVPRPSKPLDANRTSASVTNETQATPDATPTFADGSTPTSEAAPHDGDSSRLAASHQGFTSQQAAAPSHADATPQDITTPQVSVPPPPAQPAATPPPPRRRAWPVVLALSGAVLLLAVAAGWFAVRYLRKPSPTDASTQEPVAPVAPDVQQLFDEKLAETEGLLAQGNMEGALAKLREANALVPSNTKAHRRLGELLWESGARREAIEEFRAAANNDPDDFTAWRQLATWQFAEGLYGDAAESYRRVVALVGETATDPNDLLSYADALRLSGRNEEARAVYIRLTSAAMPEGIAGVARQRLQELAQATPTPAPTPRREETAEEGGEELASSSTTVPTPAPPTPTATPTPTPAPQPTAQPPQSPAERYRRGVELWSSNRGAAFSEFQAAAQGGNVDANYYLGLSYVEGKNLRSLNRAALFAALRHFQLAQRGQFAEQSRRYARQLEQEVDRIRQ